MYMDKNKIIMSTRERRVRIIGAIILFIVAMILFTSCANRAYCPTYDSAIRAKEQRSLQRFDGLNSDFCRPKKNPIKR